MGAKGRNLVLCADGTGNRGGVTRGTNVWRIYQAVDTTLPEPRQLVYYHDGVGTEDFRPWMLLGGALGVGLSRNVRALYRWLVLNYEEGDRLFLFGFSRGAFTVRTFAGLLKACGLVDRRGLPPKELAREIRKAYGQYRRTKCDPAGRLAVRPHFLGVWDTVGAVGGPPWLKGSGGKGLIPFYNYHDINANNWNVACHAIAIDDERRTFWPEFLQEPEGADVEQVWFAGSHSNVGGGYPKDGLAYVTLQWMMSRAQKAGLEFTKEAVSDANHRANPHDRIYDPRSGLRAYYRYSPRYSRKIVEWYRKHHDERAAPTHVIHESVVERIEHTTADYAPAHLFEQPQGAEGLQVASTSDHDHLKPLHAVLACDDEKTNEIKGKLKAVDRPVSIRMGLYWVLLSATLALVLFSVAEAVLASNAIRDLRASGAYAWLPDPLGATASAPFSWLASVVSFVIPFNVADGVIEAFSRLASVNRAVSVGLLAMAVVLFVWRQVLKSKARDIGLDAWRVSRQ